MASNAVASLIDCSPIPTEERTATMRLAVIGTPRSGNTWLRHLLSSAYDIPERPIHSPHDLPWNELPPSCVLQLHWHPVESFLTRLEDQGFRVIVLSRHPLDVLISILHFALHDRTARWLEGEHGNERSIFGAMPRSTPFMNYCVSKRADALLAVSREWWQVPGTVSVQYEVLNRDPHGELERIIGECGGQPVRSVEEVVAGRTLSKLRALTRHEHHFWQGRCGLWKSLLTAAEARPLAKVLQPRYADFDYDWDADPNLSAVQADANWVHLVWADLTDRLHHLDETSRALHGARQELGCTRQTLNETLHSRNLERAGREDAEQKGQVLEAELASVRTGLQNVQAQLAPFLELGPISLAMARRLRRTSLRHPFLARFCKCFLPYHEQ
jgi:hypothetical protein